MGELPGDPRMVKYVEMFQRSPYFAASIDHMVDTHNRKNADYADSDDPFSNFRKCEAFGIPAYVGCLVRLTDKLSRVGNLIRRGEENRAVAEEGLADTLLDLANYAVIALSLYREYVDKNDVLPDDLMPVEAGEAQEMLHMQYADDKTAGFRKLTVKCMDCGGSHVIGSDCPYEQTSQPLCTCDPCIERRRGRLDW